MSRQCINDPHPTASNDIKFFGIDYLRIQIGGFDAIFDWCLRMPKEAPHKI